MPSDKTWPNWALAHPDLKVKALKLAGIMSDIGNQIFIYDIWRSEEQQRLLYEGKEVQASPPGQSKHNCMDENGDPQSRAVDVAFSNDAQPWGERHPWGVLRMVAEEICGLKAISEWNPATHRFEGDRVHFELED